MRATLLISVALSVTVGASVAVAQPAAADEGAGARGAGAAPYRSPMREQCAAEIGKDADWRAQLADEIRYEVHKDEAATLVTNRRHVIYAYAAIWVLVAGFVLSLFLRQRRLVAEIDRLRDEIKRAS
jgi:CcmD family protein